MKEIRISNMKEVNIDEIIEDVQLMAMSSDEPVMSEEETKKIKQKKYMKEWRSIQRQNASFKEKEAER